MARARSRWCPLVALLLFGCDGDNVSPGTSPDAATLAADASTSNDASAPDAAPADASADADADAAPEAPSLLIVHPRVGATNDDPTPPAGPGLVLDSGAANADLLGWMRQLLFPSGPHGDLVVLTATAADSAAGMFDATTFRSAQTLSVPDGATRGDYAAAADILARAEAVWFVGGDQAKYVRWKDTALMTAVQGIYERGGVVGGSSAGMIILGSAVNDALLTLSENLTTTRLLADPFDADLHFTRDMLRFAPLAGTITDPHFSTQNRMGRLVTFMARQIEPGVGSFRGIAVDDGVALAIDAHGVGVRIGQGTGSIYVVRGGVPTQLQAGQPLRYDGLRVRRLRQAEHRYDLVRDCGSGLDYSLDVNGALEAPYSTDPYSSGVAASDCP